MSLHARLLPVALAIAIAPLGVCAHASDQAGSRNQANTTGQPDKNRQQDENALPVRTLKVRGHAIEAEVASTDAQREQGLMYRTDMPADHGMLFVFEQPALYCFWMKNTLIPLSLAFLDDRGRIISLADMQPRDEYSHCPPGPVSRALEMNQGWFGQHGVGIGDVIEGVAGQH